MSLTREDMLRELELLPVWKLREPVAAPAPLAAESLAIIEVATKVAIEAASESAIEAVIEAAPFAAQPASPGYSDHVTPADAATSVETAAASDHQAPANVSQAVTGTQAPIDDGDLVPPREDAPEFETSTDDVPTSAPDTGDARRQRIMQLDWSALQRCIADCRACGLAATRTQTVFGVGDPQAEWLIVGEAPGAEEDKRGEPFVGQAGKLLDNMLAAIKLKRGENVYIANVLKCRPPENRDPHGEEVMQCDPFLKRQVELIQPKLILALGKFAAQSLLGSDDTIGAMRGKLYSYNGVPVIVTYHPAYLLRNLPDKAKAWEDLCFAVKAMQGLQAEALQSTMQPPSSD